MIVNLENGSYVDIFAGHDSTTVEIYDQEGCCIATCSAVVEPDPVEADDD